MFRVLVSGLGHNGRAAALMEVTMNKWINKVILESDICLDISKANWCDGK